MIEQCLLLNVRLGVKDLRDTGVDRCFTSSHRHVGGVGDQRCALHDGFLTTVNVNGELADVSCVIARPRDIGVPQGSPSTLQPSRCHAHR